MLNLLLQVTAYSAVIFAVTLGVKALMKNKMSPFLHCAIWMVLVLRLMIPITLPSPVHLVTFPAVQQIETQRAINPQPDAKTQTVLSPKTGTVMNQNAAADIASETPAVPEAVAVAQPKPLQIVDILPALWAAGCGVGLGYLLLLYVFLRRRMRKGSAPVSQRLAALFYETKREMGIQADIRLACLADCGTPALMFPKTVLIPAGTLEKLGDREIRYAFRHELTHYRRKDHILSLLLSVLNAVYWFNPVVWIAVRTMRADMETACDWSVVKKLDAEQKGSYAAFIVGLFAAPLRSLPAVGLAKGDAKKLAEKRVRGIFAKGASTRGAKLVSAALVCVMLLACFTTACEPAAALSVKGSYTKGLIAEATAKTVPGTLKERLQLPDRFTGSAQDATGTVSINIDAKITLPDADGLPVAFVEPANFSHKTVDKIKSLFFDNSKWYDPDALSEPTKAEYMDLLPKLQARRAELKQQGMQPLQLDLDAQADGKQTQEQVQFAANASTEPSAEDSEPGPASSAAFNQLDEVNQSIAFINKNLPNATEGRNLKEVSGELNTEPVPSNATEKIKAFYASHPIEKLFAAQLNPKGGMRTLSIYNMYMDSSIEYINRGDYDRTRGYYTTKDVWEDPDDINAVKNIALQKALKEPVITAEAAEKAAEGVLKQLGIEDMTCVLRQKVIGGTMQSWGDDTLERGKILKAYELQYVRKVNGVPVTYTDIGEADGDENAKFGWIYERLTLVINDDGIVELQWYAPYAKPEIVTKNASLLPFPRIAEIVKQKSLRLGDTLAQSEKINITEARLGLMRIVDPEDTQKGIMIPVWDFFGNGTETLQQDGKMYTSTFGGEESSLLTLNAIDGIVIDRQKGYPAAEAPDVTVKVGGQKTDGLLTDYEMPFDVILKEKPGFSVYTAADNADCTFEIQGEKPDTVTLKDSILKPDGTLKYTEKETQILPVNWNGTKGSFILAKNPAQYLSSNSDDYKPGQTMRGFTLTLAYGKVNYTYHFMLKT